MDFDEFLLKTANSKLLNPKYIPTLIAVFGKKSHGKSIEKCCEEFLKDVKENVQPRQTTGSYLKEIYKFFWEKYPELPPVSGKGQRKVLTDYFVKLYEKREDIDDKIDRSQSLTKDENIEETEQAMTQEDKSLLNTSYSIPKRNYDALRQSPRQNLLDPKLVDHEFIECEKEFIGREKELSNIIELLHPDRNRIIAIYGIGGVGKTALAMEAAYRCLEAREIREKRLNPENINYQIPSNMPEFDVFIFISAKRQNFIDGKITESQAFARTLQEIHRDLFKFFEIPFSLCSREEQLNTIKNQLEKQRSLLIIDNLEDLERPDLSQLIKFINELPPSTWTILTSRQDIGFLSISLESLEKNDAILLMEQQVKCKKTDTDILTTKEKNQIYQVTGGVPLCIIHFIHCLSNGERFNDVINKYQNIDREIIGKFLFEDEIKKLRKEEFAYRILLSISLFALAPTGDSLIYVADLDKEDNALIEKSFEQLFDLSFVSKQARKFGDSSVGCYKVISLTAVYVKQELEKNKDLRQQLTRRWIAWHKKYLSEHLDNKNKDQRLRVYKEKIEPEWKNFSKVLLYCKDNFLYDDIKDLWFSRLNNFANISGEWNSRLSWLKWIEDAAASRGDHQTRIKAMAYRSRTLLLQSSSENLEKAYQLLLQSWEQKDCVQEFRTTDYIANHLAGVCVRLKRYNEAHQWLNREQEILDSSTSNLTQNEILKYQTFINRERGEIYFNDGKLEEAESLCEFILRSRIEEFRDKNYASRLLADIIIAKEDESR